MSERIDIPAEIVVRLRAPLPPEAIKPHPTKAYLSTIKTIYSIERLNDVFGMNGWVDRYQVIEANGPMVVVKGELEIPEYGIRREAFGGNDNTDRGDAYKGACTDALSKMAAALYIGMDVYKGQPNATAEAPKADKPAAKPEPSNPAPKPVPPPASHVDPTTMITISAVEDGEKKFTVEISGKLCGTKYLGCFEKSLYTAFSENIHGKATVAYRTRESNGRTYVNIVDLLAIDGVTYREGEPVGRPFAPEITDDDLPPF